jgi:TPR repeat protein
MGKPTLRQLFREANDYAFFVKDIRPRAAAGDAEAQYLTSQALRYCALTLQLYFRPIHGQVPILKEVEARRIRRSEGISHEELADIYTRCQGFLQQPELLTDSGSWKQWLDKAVDAGNPAAMAQKALIIESNAMKSSLSQLPHAPVEADVRDQAKDLALTAVQSGDPDAIFLMADWVREGTRSAEENATFISAWQILACQKGYDCGQNSNWMRSFCAGQVQCADDRTYIDYFQRTLGNQYADALNLAKAIDQAISAKDVESIRSYL